MGAEPQLGAALFPFTLRVRAKLSCALHLQGPWSVLGREGSRFITHPQQNVLASSSQTWATGGLHLWAPVPFGREAGCGATNQGRRVPAGPFPAGQAPGECGGAGGSTVVTWAGHCAAGRARASHLCVSAGGPLGDGMSGRSSHSTGSPSWPSPGSCREAVRAAGRRQLSQPPRRCLQRTRNVLTSLQHVRSCSHQNC